MPDGKIVTNPSGAKQFMEMAGSDCMLKAQVLSAGRSKSGGVKLIKSLGEIDSAVSEMLMIKFNDLPVGLILIEQTINFKDVFNLSFYIDQVSAKPIIALSRPALSPDVHSVKATKTMKLAAVEINQDIGLLGYQIRHLAQALELPREIWDHFGKVALGLWRIFNDLDAIYLETNPLVQSIDNRLIVLNVIIEIDESALFRQNELAELIDYSIYHSIEAEALKAGLSFISLDGNIGCLANGAALAKSTMDLIQKSGGTPANYMDVGACTSAERLGAGFRLLIAEKTIESIFVNYYGISTPCDEIANEMLKARDELNLIKPVIVLFSGLNSKKGVDILNKKSPLKAILFRSETSINAHG